MVFELILRLLLGVWVCLMGFLKLVDMPSTIRNMWSPPFLGKRQMTFVVSVISVLEVCWGLASGFGLPPLKHSAIAGISLGVGLTAYGVISIIKTGQCGCTGGRATSHQHSVLGLVVRNSCIFGALVFLTVDVPGLMEIAEDDLLSVTLACSITAPAIPLGVGVVPRLLALPEKAFKKGE